MANLELKFSVSDLTLQLIDELRDSKSRDEILRQVIVLGLCELFESTSRVHRDYTTHLIAGQTKDYRLARTALFGVDEPKTVEPLKSDVLRSMTMRERIG